METEPKKKTYPKNGGGNSKKTPIYNQRKNYDPVNLGCNDTVNFFIFHQCFHLYEKWKNKCL